MNESITKTSLSRQNSFQAEKVKYLNWISKWICSISPVEELPFDLPEITAVLQAMGLQLEKLEKSVEDSQPNEDESKIIITIQCTKSNLRAILTKSDLICKCPNSDAANEGKFWVVSGTGPSSSQDNINKINESYSSLLPIIPRAKSLLIKDIIYKLLSLVDNTDINKNDNKKANLSKLSRGQSLNDLRGSSAEKSKPVLTRQQSWEVDPKTSPPVSTSSPLPELCKTLDQISISSDRDQALVDILHEMDENLKKALSLLPAKNNTFTMKKTVKRVSNIKVSPSISSPTRATAGESTRDIPVKITPKKVLTPRKTSQTTPVTGERKLLIPSKISSFRKKIAQSSTPDKPKMLRQDTPWLTSKSQTPNKPQKKLNPLATKMSSLRSSDPNLTTVTSNSGLTKPKSGIPAFASKFSKPASTSATGLKKFK